MLYFALGQGTQSTGLAKAQLQARRHRASPRTVATRWISADVMAGGGLVLKYIASALAPIPGMPWDSYAPLPNKITGVRVTQAWANSVKRSRSVFFIMSACLRHCHFESPSACGSKPLQAELSCHHNDRIFNVCAFRSDLSRQINKLGHTDLIH